MPTTRSQSKKANEKKQEVKKPKKNEIKIKLESKGESPFWQGVKTNRAFELKYIIVDWKEKGDQIEAVQKIIYDTLKQNSKYDDYEYALNGDFFDETHHKIGWFLSNWSDLDSLKFYTGYYVQANAFIRRFTVFMRKPYNMFTNTVGQDDINNDCVFNCIAKAHNYEKDKLPKKINTPAKFKRHFNYERDEMVDLFAIIEELQILLKSSIEICGDRQYSPKHKLARNIRLKWKDSHVTLLNNTGKQMTVGTKFKPIEKDNLVFYKFSDDVDSVSIYNYGDTEEQVVNLKTFDEMKELEKTKFLYIKCDFETNLEQESKKYIKKAEYFNDLTKKMINYYKSPYQSLLAFDVWRQMTKNISVPEELTDNEHFALDQANVGGAHYAVAGTHENCIDIDMNAMYMFFMSQLNFTFPTTKGSEHFLTQDEINTKTYFPYGVYKCKITSDSEFINIEMQKNIRWHSHFILTIVKQSGGKVEMFKDGMNHIAYDTQRINGNIAFKSYADWAFKLRKEAKEEYKSESKLYTSSLWGILSAKNKKVKRFQKDELIDIDKYNFEQLIPCKNGGYTVYYSKKRKIFKTPYGRIGCFLVGYCRLKLFEIAKKLNYEIVMINTDGMILKGKTEIPKLPTDMIGAEAGKFKIINHGTVIISHSNSYKFI